MVDRDEQPLMTPEEAVTSEPFERLHKVLTWIAFVLLVGVSLEGALFFPWVLIRFGWAD